MQTGIVREKQVGASVKKRGKHMSRDKMGETETTEPLCGTSGQTASTLRGK